MLYQITVANNEFPQVELEKRQTPTVRGQIPINPYVSRCVVGILSNNVNRGRLVETRDLCIMGALYIHNASHYILLY
jgi:hypothetical protein